MKNLRKLIIGGTLILAMSSTVLAGEMPQKEKADNNAVVCVSEECYIDSYSHLTEEQEAELKELETQFDQLCIQLEPLYTQADEIVKDLEMIDIFANFDNFKKVMIKDTATDKQMRKVKELFEDLKLVEDDNEKDFERAMDAWEQLDEMEILKDTIVYSDVFDVSQLPEAKRNELADLDVKIIELEKQLEAIYNKIEETYGEAFFIDVDDMDCCYEDYTFDDFKVDCIKEEATKEQVAEAASLFEAAIQLEEDEKWDEAEKVWDELFDKDYIIEYDFEVEPYTFEDFKMELKDNVSQEDLEKAKMLFNQVLELEVEEKFDEAEEVWEQLWEMDIYDFEYEEYDYEDLIFEDFDLDEIEESDLD